MKPMRMRGELCIGVASFLSFAALILLIFTHVGQINTSTVPRGIYMARMNVSNYGAALHSALTDPIDGLYTTNSSSPLLLSNGLRDYYNFGLYDFCGYITITSSTNTSTTTGSSSNSTSNSTTTGGICTNKTIGFQYKPYSYLIADMAANYSIITASIIQGGTFVDSNYLGESTKAAYWMLLVGTVVVAVGFFSGLLKHSLTFFLSAFLAGLSSLFLLVSATLWTVVINKSNASVSGIEVGVDPINLGINISAGPGLFMLWAAFACEFVSMAPYLISCCTYRG